MKPFVTILLAMFLFLVGCAQGGSSTTATPSCVGHQVLGEWLEASNARRLFSADCTTKDNYFSATLDYQRPYSITGTNSGIITIQDHAVSTTNLEYVYVIGTDGTGVYLQMTRGATTETFRPVP